MAGAGLPGAQPVVGQPYLFEASATAGDTGTPAVLTTTPSFEVTRPDGSVVDGEVLFIPIRTTGTLLRQPGQPLEDEFLTAQWLLPASLTATFSPGVHAATVRWAGNVYTEELDFKPPSNEVQAAIMGALTLCEAGRSKNDPQLMLSGLDAGFAVAPRDVHLALCLADALKAQGYSAAAREVVDRLPPGSLAPRGAFEFLLDRLPDGGAP